MTFPQSSRYCFRSLSWNTWTHTFKHTKEEEEFVYYCVHFLPGTQTPVWGISACGWCHEAWRCWRVSNPSTETLSKKYKHAVISTSTTVVPVILLLVQCQWCSTFSDCSTRSSFFMFQSNFLQSHEIFSQFTPTFIHCGIGPLHTGETQRGERRGIWAIGILFIDFWSQKQTLQQKEWTVRQSFLHWICRKGQKTLH